MTLDSLYVKETKAISRTKGSLLVAESIPGVQFNEMVDVRLASGEIKRGQAIDISKEATIIQVFGGVSEVDLVSSRVRCKGETLKLPVAKDILGRIFNGSGDPIDGGPAIIPEDYLDVNGGLVNPAGREPPTEFIETGISAIDGLNALVRGQKLPIFSGSGLPHNRIVAQIIRQASVKKTEEQFAIVFGAIGISYDDADFFMQNLEQTGAREKTVAFINTASDTDITNYCEALRELSAMREEIPSRRGYPGYMYTDLATMYERAGRITGKEGSVTVMPILTMPDDDITHPIPDLTGYITEGQIVLSRELERKGVYPPIDVFLSLSRMMKEGIGAGKTREDHNNVFMQLYAAYAEGCNLREISTIIGAEALGERDRVYLNIADRFEKEFISQGEVTKRRVEDTLDIGWALFSALPEEDLKLIGEDLIKKYLPKYAREA